MSDQDSDGELRCKFDICATWGESLTNVHLPSIKDLSKLPHFQQHVCKINNINISWLPLRSHISRTCTLAHHMSLGSSMVRASHRSSEGCGFDPCLVLRNRFSEVRAWRTFIYHLRYLQAPTSPTHKIVSTVNIVNYDCIILPYNKLIYTREVRCTLHKEQTDPFTRIDK